jgi:hypothetical protein
VCAGVGLDDVVTVLERWRRDQSPLVGHEVDGPRAKPCSWVG